MGCTTSHDVVPNDTIHQAVLDQLSMTPLGYHLSSDEVRTLCTDGKLVQASPGNTIYDRITAYQPNDKSTVVCMFYFGILTYGVAEVETFDNSFSKQNYTIGPGSILLGEHLFDTGKRHSLNRGYNITATTQCSIFLVNLKTFERYSKSLTQQRIDWWTAISSEPAGNALSSIFPNIPLGVRNELMTRVNWRALEPSQRLHVTPPFDPHAASLALPTSHHSQFPAPTSMMQPKPQDSSKTSAQTDPTVPFQYQLPSDPLGPRSLFILIKGKLRKYPQQLPQDPACIQHHNIIVNATNAGQTQHGNGKVEQSPFDIEFDYEELAPATSTEDHNTFHRRIKPRLEIYHKNHILSQLSNGFIEPGEPCFEMTTFNQAQFLLQPYIIAQERSLVLEIPHHVYLTFVKTAFFHPVVTIIQQLINKQLAQLVMACNIDFFRIGDQLSTNSQQAGQSSNTGQQGLNAIFSGDANGGGSPSDNCLPALQENETSRAVGESFSPIQRDTNNSSPGTPYSTRTLNLRGQNNVLQIQQQYQQQQLQFFQSLIDMSEIFLVKAGTVVHESNRTVIDRLTIVLHGHLLVQNVEAFHAHDQLQQQGGGSATQNGEAKTQGYNAILYPGDYFNELGLVNSYSRPYGIKALTSCIYLTLSRANFERLISNRDVSLFCIKLGRAQAPLEAILSHPQTSDAFYQLAQSEHSTENLDFYKRILEFRSKMEGVTRTEVKVIRDASGRSVMALSYPYLYTELLDIYNYYIRPDHAVAQVNLPHHVVDNVREQLFDDETHGVGPDGLIEGLTHKCLDQALAEVILLMRRDILSRFLVSEPYAKILTNLKQYQCAWKDDRSSDAKKWGARLRAIRPDSSPDFPADCTTEFEKKDLEGYLKFLEEIGMGVGNNVNLQPPSSD